MSFLIPNIFLQRLIYPLIIAICGIYRPTITSATYLCLLLWLPYVPIARPPAMRRHTKIFLLFAIILSSAFLVMHLVFQLVHRQLIVDRCDATEHWMLHLGTINISDMKSMQLLWVLPDLVMWLTSITMYVLLRRLSRGALGVIERKTLPFFERGSIRSHVGNACAMLSLMVAAVIHPCVPNAVYFLLFLGAASWWACNRTFGRPFYVMCHIVRLLLVMQVALIMFYQTAWSQEHLPHRSLIARLLGLPVLLEFECIKKTETFIEITRNATVAPWLLLFTLLCCYMIISFSVRRRPSPNPMDTPSTPDLRKRSANKRSPSGGTPRPVAPTTSRQFVNCCVHLIDMSLRHIYILNNIMLMVWSIVFHGWLTFVFLLWANVLWVIPNQRVNMMHSSPFIVMLAELLLVVQYVHSFQLRPNEMLPMIVQHNQTGIVPNAEYDPYRILLQILLLCCFWVTLRRYMFERAATAVGDVVGHREREQLSNWASKLGTWMRQFLLRLWIWVVMAFMLVLAIYGVGITAFHIVYMVLFVWFVITFQFSLSFWTKMMNIFWIAVISFAMCTLVLIYSYQFNGCDRFWEKHLGIPISLQHDIGLKQYKTRGLFLHLLYPTIVVIMTVVQMQLFHDKYLAQLQFAVNGLSSKTSSEQEVNRQASRSTSRTHLGANDDQPFRIVGLSIGKINSKNTKRILLRLWNYISWLWNVALLMIEFHLAKVLLIYAFYLCLEDVSVLNATIVVLAMIAAMQRTRMQKKLCSAISLLVGLMVVVKMIYQISTIRNSWGQANCPTDLIRRTNSDEENIESFENNVHWIGLIKISETRPFRRVFGHYIVYLLLSTFYTFVRLHMKHHRFVRNQPIQRPQLIFPGIGREQADKGLPSMIKYLINNFGCKFGVELTFMLIVLLVDRRKDVIALVHLLCLIALLFGGARVRKTAWPFYRATVFVLLLLHYLIVVGIPPFLCLDTIPHRIDTEPTASPHWRPFQILAWLPDRTLAQRAHLMIFDFLLLLSVSRQQLVFDLESRGYSPGDRGGTKPDEMRQTGPSQHQDFTTEIRCWLDLIKCIVFIAFHWLTLTIVFIVAVTNVSIFSIGYLIGAYIFLWQGTAFYLRPMKTVMTWWSWLIGYNLGVIGLKLLMQIPGCIFAPNIQHVCKLYHTTGITCEHTRLQNSPYDPPPAVQCSEQLEAFAGDNMCFVFMVLQLRVMQSQYFCYVVNEIKAVSMLLSRGASLIGSLHQEEMRVQNQRDAAMLIKIKGKMDTMKANQMSIKHKPKTHFEALYSGDYSLFNEPLPRGSNVAGFRQTTQESSSESFATARDYDISPDQSAAIGGGGSTVVTDEVVLKKKSIRDHFVCKFLAGLMYTVTLRLYKMSSKYRYVMSVLAEEKKQLKSQKEFSAAGHPWCPMFEHVTSESSKENAPEDDDFKLYQRSLPAEFFKSIVYAILANTDLLCYLFVFINVLASPSLMALPMPLMIFLWGTLSVTRPSKSFWITLMAYIQVVVLIKCVCRLEVFWWNVDTFFGSISPNHFSTARIIGIDQQNLRITYDLALLMSIFFHRYMQYMQGIWGSERDKLRVAGVYAAEFDRNLLQRRQSNDAGKFPQNNATYLRSSVDTAASTISQELLNVQFQDHTYQGVQMVTLQQGELLLRLTKVGIDDEQAENTQLVHVVNMPQEAADYLPDVITLSIKKYCSSCVHFFKELMSNEKRVIVDVYSSMFLCDFINFFVIALGSNSAADDSQGLATYVEKNQVPIGYLVLLLLQFMCIIVDRALYLRRNLMGKFVFHVLSVFSIHVYLFILLPHFSRRTVINYTALSTFYILKCFYFLFSAKQIRSGYPPRIIGNWITRGYSLISMGIFDIYMIIPFLFELRSLMDWIWTDTSLSLFQWLKMEDIYGHTYQTKCYRRFDEDAPDPRGECKSSVKKYLLGGLLFLLIIAFIWGPLALFAVTSKNHASVMPSQVQLELRIGTYEPIYIGGSRLITAMDPHKFENILSYLSNEDIKFVDYVDGYRNSITTVNLFSSTQSSRMLTVQQANQLARDLQESLAPEIFLTVTLTRDDDPTDDIMNTLVLTKILSLKNDVHSIRPKLISMLGKLHNHKKKNIALILPNIFPKLIAVSPRKMVSWNRLQEAGHSLLVADRSLRLSLVSEERSTSFRLTEACPKGDTYRFFNCSSDGMTIYMFSDTVEKLSFLNHMSIIGIYTTFCWMFSRLVRKQVFGNVYNLVYIDEPQVDGILQLCFDIYLVRTNGDFALEEDLFAKLLFLHRSPETLIAFTRLTDHPTPLERWDIEEVEATVDRKIRELRRRLGQTLPMWNRQNN